MGLAAAAATAAAAASAPSSTKSVAADDAAAGAPSKTHEFLWTSTVEPHAARRKAILAAHGDEVRKLYGYDVSTAVQVGRMKMERQSFDRSCDEPSSAVALPRRSQKRLSLCPPFGASALSGRLFLLSFLLLRRWPGRAEALRCFVGAATREMREKKRDEEVVFETDDEQERRRTSERRPTTRRGGGPPAKKKKKNHPASLVPHLDVAEPPAPLLAIEMTFLLVSKRKERPEKGKQEPAKQRVEIEEERKKAAPSPALLSLFSTSTSLGTTSLTVSLSFPPPSSKTTTIHHPPPPSTTGRRRHGRHHRHGLLRPRRPLVEGVARRLRHRRHRLAKPLLRAARAVALFGVQEAGVQQGAVVRVQLPAGRADGDGVPQVPPGAPLAPGEEEFF